MSISGLKHHSTVCEGRLRKSRIEKKESIVLKMEVFDPAMCCSTGVCGPVVDPVLPRFAADLDWLKSRGVSVERFNLAQQPDAFARNEAVKQALGEGGTECLPLILVDGRIVSRGAYPARKELAAFAGLELEEPASIYSPGVAELVALGASIASNCMPCFDYHYAKARELGLSDEDIALVVKTALGVKQASAQGVLGVAERHLGRRFTTEGPEGTSGEKPDAPSKHNQALFPMAGSGSSCCPSSDCC
jgi:AhpD family alkylhydroperoxidase